MVSRSLDRGGLHNSQRQDRRERWPSLLGSSGSLDLGEDLVPRFGAERFVLLVKSDSISAIGALLKARSSSPMMNLISREIHLCIARLNYSVALKMNHIAGVDNTWADVLSRLYEPGATKVVPASRPQLLESRCSFPFSVCCCLCGATHVSIGKIA